MKEGLAKVKEDGWKGLIWKQKYLVLREHTLDFHKAENSATISFSIAMRDIVNVSRAEDTPLTFEICRLQYAGSGPAGGLGLSTPTQGLPTKIVLCQVKSDEDLYEWVDSIYARCPGMGAVSNPTNFTHKVHVGFDPVSGQFTGLPKEWEKLLHGSALTKDDFKNNPQAVIEVLEFYTDIKNRADHPNEYTQLAPTPAVMTQNRQLGFDGGMGGSMPRSMSNAPPTAPWSGPLSANHSFSSDAPTLVNGMPATSRTAQGDSQAQVQDPQRQQQQRLRQEQMNIQQRQADEQQRRMMQGDRDRGAGGATSNGRDQRTGAPQDRDDYDASIPQTRTPGAKQELVGYGASSDSPESRYNPTRQAPSAPSAERSRQAPPASLRNASAQRAAPSAPNGSAGGSLMSPRAAPQTRIGEGGKMAGNSTATLPYRPAPPGQQQYDNRRPQDQQGSHLILTSHSKSGSIAQQPSKIPTPAVKPLNIQIKQPTGAAAAASGSGAGGVKEAAAALSKPESARTKESSRMSTLTEAQVMDKLSKVVSPGDPNGSYQKSKKVGQGASGSVYLAKVLPTANSDSARKLLRLAANPKDVKVAIKQMDLANQPRKELIVNEILVMKESQHPNIVNFVDAYLRSPNELWVIMEYMEGGALTDIIENNTIEEDQIAAICNEVGPSVLQNDVRADGRLTVDCFC